ncbi:MAG: low molecular weight phosphatase family protein [Pseudomonadota bacterium]
MPSSPKIAEPANSEFNPRPELTREAIPRSVLFVCNENSIRSPMAEAILKKHARGRIFVGSAGLRVGALDGFAVEVMKEWHIALEGHTPHVISDNDVAKFSLVISLTPEAQHWAVELTRFGNMALEYWPMPDPSKSEGSRTQRLEAYRELRALLKLRIEKRFDFL